MVIVGGKLLLTKCLHWAVYGRGLNCALSIVHIFLIKLQIGPPEMNHTLGNQFLAVALASYHGKNIIRLDHRLLRFRIQLGPCLGG